MQHVEFFHRDHFELKYHRKKATGSLSKFIDFFWETDFEDLYSKYPNGFSDALFPNVGYTYLINLGTPFVMQLDDEKFEIKNDAFLPRHCNMICHHAHGNKIFGIKFKVSPVVFEKKINFGEYKEYIFPLAYLIERSVVEEVKKAHDFKKRVELIGHYYKTIIDRYAGSLKYVDVVTDIISECTGSSNFNMSIEEVAQKHQVSTRTLQRYFEKATSISSKQALQLMRIRKAVEHLVTDGRHFNYQRYGYYDYSHFHKHLKQFINSHTIDILEPHLMLLRGENMK